MKEAKEVLSYLDEEETKKIESLKAKDTLKHERRKLWVQWQKNDDGAGTYSCRPCVDNNSPIPVGDLARPGYKHKPSELAAVMCYFLDYEVNDYHRGKPDKYILIEFRGISLKNGLVFRVKEQSHRSHAFGQDGACFRASNGWELMSHESPEYPSWLDPLSEKHGNSCCLRGTNTDHDMAALEIPEEQALHFLEAIREYNRYDWGSKPVTEPKPLTEIPKSQSEIKLALPRSPFPPLGPNGRPICKYCSKELVGMSCDCELPKTPQERLAQAEKFIIQGKLEDWLLEYRELTGGNQITTKPAKPMPKPIPPVLTKPTKPMPKPIPPGSMPAPDWIDF